MYNVLSVHCFCVRRNEEACTYPKHVRTLSLSVLTLDGHCPAWPRNPCGPLVMGTVPCLPRKQKARMQVKKTKTYNRRDSQMVTHSSTSRPVQYLCMAERTGCPVLTDLWSYVLGYPKMRKLLLCKIRGKLVWKVSWSRNFLLSSLHHS
jgi:hypothetical protein